jgi:hypothetical protein
MSTGGKEVCYSAPRSITVVIGLIPGAAAGGWFEIKSRLVL